MSDFDRIRPYRDDEVPEVIERILKHPDLPPAACKFILPSVFHGTRLGVWLVRRLLNLKTRNLKTVYDCQMLIAGYFERLIESTTTGLTVSGIEHLDPSKRYLFMSNHRDIVMDSGLINFLIHARGHETSRMAIGDNLLAHGLAADLMKLNKSFVIERGNSGTRAQYAALSRASAYIRHSLEENVSVWIAQKQGRAKDGFDRTDPALLKMLSLAFSEGCDGARQINMLKAYRLAPVSVSYELDPCALAKAHELRVIDTTGSYAKSEAEDVRSIITGLIEAKGRVHVHFSKPLEGLAVEDPKELAQLIDRHIVGGLRVFPTHVAAARSLGSVTEAAHVAPDVDVMRAFEAEAASCPSEERVYWYRQYANLVLNRMELGVTQCVPGNE